MILEQAPAVDERPGAPVPDAAMPCALSARSGQGLLVQASRFRSHVTARTDLEPYDIVYSLAMTRSAKDVPREGRRVTSTLEVNHRRFIDEIWYPANSANYDVADEVMHEDIVTHTPHGDLRGRKAFMGIEPAGTKAPMTGLTMAYWDEDEQTMKEVWFAFDLLGVVNQLETPADR